MYMRTLISWQEISTDDSKRDYYDHSNAKYKELTQNKKLSETAKEMILNNEPDIKPFFLKYKDEKRKLDLLCSNLYSIDDAIFLLSREISRRGGDWESERRNDNVQRR
jgi:hypothetical protein